MVLQQGEHIRAAPLAVQGQAWDALAESVLAGSCLALATGDWGWVGTEFARLPAARRDADLSMRLSSVLISLGTGARMEAMASRRGSWMEAASPHAAAGRSAPILKSLAVRRAGPARMAVRILELDPHYDPTAASTAARTH